MKWKIFRLNSMWWVMPPLVGNMYEQPPERCKTFEEARQFFVEVTS